MSKRRRPLRGVCCLSDHPNVMSQDSQRSQLEKRQLRFLRRGSYMREYAATAFESQFANRMAFDVFYESLTDEQKDEFLRVGSTYLFLVKKGDWHVDVEGSNSIIDYFTNSFKLVSLFSLIESMSAEDHQDFYEWLAHAGDGIYPISDHSSLRKLQEEYKVTFGSIRRCVSFFEGLPIKRREQLQAALVVKGKSAKSVREVAQFLYNLRSKFVHEGEFVLDIAYVPVMSRHKNASTLTSLSMSELLALFEEGVIAHFMKAT